MQEHTSNKLRKLLGCRTGLRSRRSVGEGEEEEGKDEEEEENIAHPSLHQQLPALLQT